LIELSFLSAFRESDQKLKDELVEKIKANIPEAKITSDVGEGGLLNTDLKK
jgi:hypothetical protein